MMDSAIFVIPWVVPLVFGIKGPESCYYGAETEPRDHALFNPNITTCSLPGMDYCYQYTHSDQYYRNVIEYGCARGTAHPCKKIGSQIYYCQDNVELLGFKNGRLCCSTETKHFVPTSFSPVSSCYTGVSNSSSGNLSKGIGLNTSDIQTMACDQTQSLYCVAKMTYLNGEITEGKFYCDKTTTNSECAKALLACSQPNDDIPGQNYTKTCCCPSPNCNIPLFYMETRQVEPQPTFPGSPMLLYILLVIFGCIVLLGLIMMAGKQCGSSGDSVDFDDKASFDRLDFDETENDEPSPQPRKLDDFAAVPVEEDIIEDKPMTKTESV